MKLRSLSPLAAAAGICIAGSAVAQEPARTSAMPAKTTTSARVSSNPVANQQLADTVATRLTTSGAAQMADVSISVVDGIVTLTGTAKDSATKELVINQVRQVAGVKKVRDGINTTSSIMLAQGVGPLAAPASVGIAPGGFMPNIEPSPLGAPGMGGGGGDTAPPLPPYAWPTYAPHNNVSRVAYPTAYPYNAFPFIGPFYPFPKVPLGWRKVTMEWDDGHWWIGKTQAPQDYWRVRFW